MADDPSIRGPRVATRIAMEQDHEVEYWTSKFGVTRAELQAGCGAVGPMMTKVAEKLGRKL